MNYIDLLVKVLVALGAVAGAVGAVFSYLRTRRLTALEELAQRRHEDALRSTPLPNPISVRYEPRGRPTAPVGPVQSETKPDSAGPVGWQTSWFGEFQDRLGPEAGERARLLTAQLSALGLRTRLTSNQNSVAFDLRAPRDGQTRAIFLIYRDGKFEFQMGNFPHYPGLADEQWRQSVLDRLLHVVPGFKISAAGTKSYPRADLLQPFPRDAWDDFTDVVEEFAEHARQ